MNIAILNAYHRYRFLPPHHKHRHDDMFNVLIDSLVQHKKTLKFKAFNINRMHHRLLRFWCWHLHVNNSLKLLFHALISVLINIEFVSWICNWWHYDGINSMLNIIYRYNSKRVMISILIITYPCNNNHFAADVGCLMRLLMGC